LSKKIEKKFKAKNIREVLHYNCCWQEHLRAIDSNFVKKWRHEFWCCRAAPEREQFVREILSPSAGCTDNNLAAFKNMCCNAMLKVLDLSDRTVRRWRSLWVQGRTVDRQHSNPRFDTKSTSAQAWLEAYCKSSGDWQPNVQTVHLPSTLRKKDVYVEYCDDMKAKNESFVSLVSSKLHLSPECSPVSVNSVVSIECGNKKCLMSKSLCKIDSPNVVRAVF
jgi:hypothetical protein